jgi:hypothetical protein
MGKKWEQDGRSLFKRIAKGNKEKRENSSEL